MLQSPFYVIVFGIIAAMALELATYRELQIIILLALCGLILFAVKKLSFLSAALSSFISLITVSTVAVLYAQMRPEAWYIGLLGPILAFAIMMFASPRRYIDAIGVLVFSVMMVSLVLTISADKPFNLTKDFFKFIAAGSTSLALIQLLRRYHNWITRLLVKTEENNAQLKIARDSLEEQVQIRTRQLEEQNIRLDLAHQEALRLSQVKSNFLATMSHEIRTPMNGILGMSELLLTSGLNDDQLEQATVVFESGQGLLALLNDILDFSRIESGQFKVKLEPCDLKSSIDEATKLMSARAKEKNITLSVHLVAEDGNPSSTDWKATGDVARIRQVLFNLVGNAVKFTKSGFVKITLRRQPDFIFCDVEDSGPGVPDNFKESLFQPFMQAEPPNVRQEGGSGLGLAISKQLMMLMNGDIGYIPSEEKGAKFWFKLPRAK